MSITNFFQNLGGSWAFTREISSLNRKIIGTASFTSAGNNLLYYYESGINHQKNEFFREYFYLLNEEQNKIEIYFDKSLKSFFSEISNINQDANYFEHICNQDIYLFKIIIKNSSEYISDCTIKGPEKDFSIKTIYAKPQ